METSLLIKTQELTSALDTITSLKASVGAMGVGVGSSLDREGSREKVVAELEALLEKRTQERNEAQETLIRLQATIDSQGSVGGGGVSVGELRDKVSELEARLEVKAVEAAGAQDMIGKLQGVLQDQEEMLEQQDQLLETKEKELLNCEAGM